MASEISPKFTAFQNRWDAVEQSLVGLLGLTALLISLWQVLGRYLFPAESISYAEETAVYLIVWGVMIISSQLVRRDGHVRPDLVLRMLPEGAARWVEVFNCLVAIAFCAGLVWSGLEITETSAMIDERSASDLQFPMWIYYASLPAGSALMLLRYVIRCVRYLWFYDSATMRPGHIVHETVDGLSAPKLG